MMDNVDYDSLLAMPSGPDLDREIARLVGYEVHPCVIRMYYADNGLDKYSDVMYYELWRPDGARAHPQRSEEMAWNLTPHFTSDLNAAFMLVQSILDSRYRLEYVPQVGWSLHSDDGEIIHAHHIGRDAYALFRLWLKALQVQQGTANDRH